MTKIMRWVWVSVLVLGWAAAARAEVTSVAIKPSATDPEIKDFDNAHWIYINRDVVVEHKSDLPGDRHELFLWLTGTGGKGHDAQGLAEVAADLGYHVVTLMYPDSIAANECKPSMPTAGSRSGRTC